MIKNFTSFILIVSVIFINFGFMVPHEAIAAGTITSFSDTMTNLSATQASNHTIVFTTPTGVAAGATLSLTFDANPNLSTIVFGDIDLQDDGVDVVLAAAPTGATWGVVPSGQVITFTNGSAAVAASIVITIKIGTNATGGTHQIVNGSAGSTVLRVGGSFGDIGSLSIAIISNSIVAVSAEVLSSLSFTVSSNALYFGNLRSSGVCFAQNTNPGYVTCPTTTETEAFNMTAGTNATTGYTISVQGDTLRSGVTNTITALASNTASIPGTEQFGLRATAAGSGTGVVDAPYAAAGFAYTATTSTPTTVAHAAAATLSNTYSVRYLANIAPETQAGRYTTSHTYVATGNF